jgi:ABC-type metal ion transport system substrate-binding protein
VNYKAHLRLWSVLVKNKNEENNFMIKKFQKKYGEETVSEVTAERYDGKR